MKVNGFSDAVGSLNDVSLVDAVIVYVDNEGCLFLLVMYNALYIPSMDHHLIPPFILREAGLKVDETPKIQSDDPGEDVHSIRDPGSGLHIHLKLRGMFSYFDCRAMSEDGMLNWRDYSACNARAKKAWNPNDESFVGFVDAEGRYVDDRMPAKRKYHLLEDDEWSGLSNLIHVMSTHAPSSGIKKQSKRTLPTRQLS